MAGVPGDTFATMLGPRRLADATDVEQRGSHFVQEQPEVAHDHLVAFLESRG